MDIGEKIKYLRLNSNLTSKELSKILNISASALSLYENGKRQPKLDLIVKISDYFNVSTDFLLGVTNHTIKLNGNDEIDFSNVLEDILILLNENKPFVFNGKKMDKISCLIFKNSMNMLAENMNIVVGNKW